MQLHYLLVVIVVNDVKVMSSAVANYNIRTEPHFSEPNRTKLIPNQIRLFSKTKQKLNRCLSVVSFNSTKCRVESFILSYVGYRFVTACS